MMAASERPGRRALLAVLGVAVALGCTVPPFAAVARRHVWAESLQFTLLAGVVPALVVAGAPWRPLGFSRPARALAEARRRHAERWRVALFVAVAAAVAAAWRTPAAVDRLHGGGWPVVLEAVTLALAGVGLWLECIESPPLVPRSIRPVRIAVAAVSMWVLWFLAYLVAMAHGTYYPAFAHGPGRGLSTAADQQVAAAIMWAVAAGCFVPLVFWNLVQWLRNDEDPDHELHRLVREERRRAPTGPEG